MLVAMSTSENPYAPKSNTHDYGSYFNLFHRYFEARLEYPNVYELESVQPPDDESLKSAGFSKIFSHEFENKRSRTERMELCYEKEGVLLQFSRRESIIDRIERLEKRSEEDGRFSSSYTCRILYSSPGELDESLLAVSRLTEPNRSGRVYLMASMDGMLELQKFSVRLPGEVDLLSNYGPVAASKFEKICSLMDSGKNGLVLFSGEPGTGKSTFIKALASRSDRKIIYLSSSSAEHLTNPEFLAFMMRQRNSVLLLEDAEKVLRSRDEQDNSAISNLLNVTDGILGDCLNVMVIATFNIGREKIDPALVRKGRLLVEHHFEPLSADMANLLLEKLGSERRVSGPTSLAEIYNPEENFHEEKERRKVGF